MGGNHMLPLTPFLFQAATGSSSSNNLQRSHYNSSCVVHAGSDAAGSDEENDGVESVGATSYLGTWGRKRLETLPNPLGRQSGGVCVVLSQLE